jgi:cell division protein ZapA
VSELNRVEVVIGGEIITLVSIENEEYMQKLARYINRKMADIKAVNSNASINERTRTVFIAANIADDYFKAKDKSDELELELKKYVTELGQIQEENLLLTDKIKELQDKLNQARKELDEYITNFDANNIVHFTNKEPKTTARKQKSAGTQ